VQTHGSLLYSCTQLCQCPATHDVLQPTFPNQLVEEVVSVASQAGRFIVQPELRVNHSFYSQCVPARRTTYLWPTSHSVIMRCGDSEGFNLLCRPLIRWQRHLAHTASTISNDECEYYICDHKPLQIPAQYPRCAHRHQARHATVPRRPAIPRHMQCVTTMQ